MQSENGPTGKKSIVMIGNSHIDPVWLWKSDEGFQEVKATFRSALDRLKEFPDFAFTAGSASFYHWLEKNVPDLFEEIRAAVASGRWSLAGGWWVEPDCNLPSGESFVRQALLGMRYFGEKFGFRPTVGYNPDSFGHHAMLPQFLLRSGLRAYAVMRPHAALLGLPSPLFRWKAPDGSEVICLRLEGEYTAWTKAGIRKNVDATLAALAASGLPSLPAFYGVGNHGGGPTIENIKAVMELILEDDRAVIRFGSLESFFSTVDASSLPVYEGGLEKIFPGCYSADSGIKESNRLAETAALEAETLSSFAFLATGRAYPAEDFSRIWRSILFNQFHDTLAGTSREDARNEAVDELRAASASARGLSASAIQTLAETVDTRGEGEPLILFNAEACAFSGTVEADIPWVKRKPIRLKAPDGTEIPYQESSYGLTAPDARKLLTFDAEIPPAGWAVYRLYVENPLVKAEPADVKPDAFSNPFFSLAFDGTSGTPGSFRTASGGKAGDELLASPFEFKVYEDVRDTWGAEGDWKKHLGSFATEDFRVIEEGPLRTVFRGVHTFGRSRLVAYYRLYRTRDFLDVDVELFNAEKHVQIVLAVRPSFSPFDTVAAIPYGFERRTEREGENFAHGWVDLVPAPVGAARADGSRKPEARPGLFIAPAVRYGYRVLSGEYQLILARSAVYARGSGSPLVPGVEYRCADLGNLSCTVRMHPHRGGLSGREAAVRASRLLGKPRCLLDCRHAGKETASRKSFVSLESDTALLTALKGAEDGKGLVVRLAEASGSEAPAVLRIGENSVRVAMKPFEIRTLRFDPASGSFAETDMLEEPLGKEDIPHRTGNDERTENDE